MKKKLRYIVPIFIIVSILIYLFTTPIGSLRFTVLRYGYPINAINLKFSTDTYKTPIDIKKIKLYILLLILQLRKQHNRS